jgi:hypothetical protein
MACWSWSPRSLMIQISSEKLRAIESNIRGIRFRIQLSFTMMVPVRAGAAFDRNRYGNIAKALETIATGLLSVALNNVTRPKLMVRPSRTTRASASTSDFVTARMKCVV